VCPTLEGEYHHHNLYQYHQRQFDIQGVLLEHPTIRYPIWSHRPSLRVPLSSTADVHQLPPLLPFITLVNDSKIADHTSIGEPNCCGLTLLSLHDGRDENDIICCHHGRVPILLRSSTSTGASAGPCVCQLSTLQWGHMGQTKRWAPRVNGYSVSVIH
jgi:hypothetical protein